MAEENGKKNDQDWHLKPKMGLIPQKAIWEVAKVMSYGAEKYTQVLEFDSNSMLEWYRKELEEWQSQNANIVVKIDLLKLEECAKAAITTSGTSRRTKECALPVIKDEELSPEDSVGLATKSGSNKITQPIENDKEKTQGNGQLETKHEFTSEGSYDGTTQILEQETKRPSILNILKIEDLQKKQVKVFYKTRIISAPYADETLANVKYILITTIIQESQEVIYAVAATTVLDSLMSALQILKGQYNIFRKVLQTNIQGDKAVIKFTGAYNWLGGIKYSRLYDAAMRHLNQFVNGQDLDDETGINHLAHCACCILMLLEMTMRRPDMDDRYKEPKAPEPVTLIEEMIKYGYKKDKE